jgi:hypothetical protein
LQLVPFASASMMGTRGRDENHFPLPPPSQITFFQLQ